MFERYTERARRVIFYARYEASAFAAPSIDTEHLLLGLLREGGGATGRVFRRGHVTYEAVRKEIERDRPPPVRAATSVDIPLSSQTKHVLQHAAEEADRMNAPGIYTEHLLLGLLLESGCLAADILNSQGLRLEDVREEIRLESQPEEGPPRPQDALRKLAEFLRELEDRRAAYHVAPFHQEAVRVEVAIPEERWVVTFFADGRVAVEVFSMSGPVEGEPALARLLDRLGPPPKDDG